jgi:hypothetical protein
MSQFDHHDAVELAIPGLPDAAKSSRANPGKQIEPAHGTAGARGVVHEAEPTLAGRADGISQVSVGCQVHGVMALGAFNAYRRRIRKVARACLQ